MSNLKDIKDSDIKLTIGGKERVLRFDLNAVAELEEKIGTMEVVDAQLRQGKMKIFRTYLWAGLIHAEPELTEKEVGSWLTLDEISKLVETLNTKTNIIDEDKEDTPKNSKSQTQKK
jgi:hypothetical protein